MGDFNLADVDWINIKSQKDTPLHNLLIEIIHDNFLTQMVHQPTRDKNILNLILTTSVDYVQDVEVGDPFSDHNEITFKIYCNPYENRKSRRQFYCYKRADWNKLKELLSLTPWELAWDDEVINNSWLAWKDLLLTAIDECIPKVNAKEKYNPPWISRELVKLCRKKKTAFKRAKNLNYYKKTGIITKNLMYWLKGIVIKRGESI